METALLILAVVAAASFCPLMMWWQRRRGNDAACCMPRARDRTQASGTPASAEELREQQRRLATRIAELEADEQPRSSR